MNEYIDSIGSGAHRCGLLNVWRWLLDGDGRLTSGRRPEHRRGMPCSSRHAMIRWRTVMFGMSSLWSSGALESGDVFCCLKYFWTGVTIYSEP